MTTPSRLLCRAPDRCTVGRWLRASATAQLSLSCSRSVTFPDHAQQVKAVGLRIQGSGCDGCRCAGRLPWCKSNGRPRWPACGRQRDGPGRQRRAVSGRWQAGGRSAGKLVGGPPVSAGRQHHARVGWQADPQQTQVPCVLRQEQSCGMCSNTVPSEAVPDPGRIWRRWLRMRPRLRGASRPGDSRPIFVARGHGHRSLAARRPSWCQRSRSTASSGTSRWRCNRSTMATKGRLIQQQVS